MRWTWLLGEYIHRSDEIGQVGEYSRFVCVLVNGREELVLREGTQLRSVEELRELDEGVEVVRPRTVAIKEIEHYATTLMNMVVEATDFRMSVFHEKYELRTIERWERVPN